MQHSWSTVVRRVRKPFIAATAVAAALSVAGCGDSDGTSIVRSPAVSSPTLSYSLGGSVAGLGDNTGLVLANTSATLSIDAGATTFAFPTPIDSGTAYAVSVKSAPAGLTCTVAGGSGTLSNDVSNVVVTCADQAYTVGGTIALAAGSSSGLAVTGLVLANGMDTLSVPTGASTFTMPTSVAYGSSYQVTVKTQPSGMSCAVNPSAPSTLPASNVTDVQVTCTDQPYAIQGKVTITAPSGVTLSDQGLVLTNTSNGDSYTFSSNATSFTMPKPVAYGAAYALTVSAQPAGLACAFNLPSGTMPAGSVSLAVICADQSYSVGGSVTINGPNGVTLSDSGLALANSNGDSYTFTTNAASFTMHKSVPYGSPYAISVARQPYGLNCSVSNPSTTMPAGGVTTVAVTCADSSYALGGTIAGLGPASGLVLTNNGADATTILANATTFSLKTPVPYGAAYAVVAAQTPTDMSCTATRGSGNMPDTTVNNVAITCVTADTVLYSFANNATDGGHPFGGLIQGSDGNFYGVTTNGGASSEGTLFVYNPTTQTETLLHSFADNATDGGDPVGGLIQGTDGNFYGLTDSGGSNTPHLGGTLFVYNPTTHTETLLYSFLDSATDGGGPEGSLIQGADGNFYGLTAVGGAQGAGTVFVYDPIAHAETLLYSFANNATDGGGPYGNLIQGTDGNFYGMTLNGGEYGNGTIFVYNPTAHTETLLHSFALDATDGGHPYGSLIQGTDGNLYGMTFQGGTPGAGTLFAYNLTTQTETLLHSFPASDTDGGAPEGSLIQATDGNIYGLTDYGGAYGTGTMFVYNPTTQTETMLHSFANSVTDGGLPNGSLIQGADGYFYGMTINGGKHGAGTVFKIK